MKYFIVEHVYPTNHPGVWSEQRIFTETEEEKAKDYFTSLLTEDSVELPKTEWDDGGPNWKIVEHWELDDDEYVIVKEVNND